MRQAEEALRVFYREVEPAGWARNWPVDLMPKSLNERLPDEAAAEVQRPPTAGGASEFSGRSDTGELPEKYQGVLEAA